LPGPALHFLLARDFFDDRAGSEPCVPFPTADPVVRNAFLNGAIAPDAGYCPGGTRFQADLSHYLGTGRLVRCLLEAASTDIERAFAWGWVSHILADVAIHPLINRAVGRLFNRDGRNMEYADDPTAHAWVEFPLDAAVCMRHGARLEAGLHPCFDATTVNFLAGAFRDTYGVPFDTAEALATHRAAVRFCHRIHAIHRLLAVPQRIGHRRLADHLFYFPAFWLVAFPLLKAVLIFKYRRLPLPARKWLCTPPELLAEIEEKRPIIRQQMRRLAQEGLAELEDFNLDTGRVEAEPSYSLTKATLTKLEGLAGNGG